MSFSGPAKELRDFFANRILAGGTLDTSKIRGELGSIWEATGKQFESCFLSKSFKYSVVMVLSAAQMILCLSF
jgi:hypothetical protein